MKVVNVLNAVAFNPEKLKKVGLFDTDNFFCDIYCFEPGQSQKVHSHDGSDKVYYVLQALIAIHSAMELNPTALETILTNL